MATLQGGPESTGDAVASDLATLTAKLKVHISKSLMNAAGWTAETSSLVAELIDTGRIRLHVEAKVRSAIDVRLAELQQSESADRAEKTATLIR